MSEWTAKRFWKEAAAVKRDDGFSVYDRIIVDFEPEAQTYIIIAVTDSDLTLKAGSIASGTSLTPSQLKLKSPRTFALQGTES